VSSTPATVARAAPRFLNAVELEWKQRIFQRLLSMLDLAAIATVDDKQARTQIRELANRLIVDESVPLSLAQRQLIVRQIEDEVMGLGPLEPLLADPAVSDILVNGSQQVYIERGGKLERTAVRFHDDAHLMNIIDRIVSAVGRRIDESQPMVDARLKDGSRVNVIIPPLAIDGPVLSIRRFGVEALTPADLVRFGTLSDSLVELLRAVVRARLNVVISGGTGSGKTTLLNVMSGFIPENERIVTIEDSAELQLRQPHVVRLETRQANIEGRGQVTQRDLVRNSLRMRPDRIVVGEVRGAEALDMLQAMNTGHDGSLTTVHANSARDALSRIETMVAMTGMQFPIHALRAQIASAIHVVIQTERHEDGRRRLTSLQEINGMEGDTITMSEIFTFTRRGLDAAGNVQGELAPTGIVPGFHQRMKQRGIALPIETFGGRPPRRERRE
jgi:pilus assembly protein CpaF